MAEYAITWVRHGETIAQLIEHANDDYPFLLMDLNNMKDTTSSRYDHKRPKPTEKDITYEKEFNIYRKKVIENEIKNYDRFEDKLNEQYNIKDRVNEMNADSIKNNKKLLDFNVFFPDDKENRYINLKDDDVLQSQVSKQETDIWHLNTIFSKQISPSSWYFTPTLDSVGIMEAKKFGRDFLNDNINTYDAIICSPTVRTIMTALYALEAAEQTGRTIIIIPYINEPTLTDNKGIEERANIGIPTEIIDDVIKIIRYHLKKDLSLTHFKNDIDTSFYKAESKINPYKPGDNSMTSYLFTQFEKGKKLIEENIIKDGKKNVLAFVHAYFIKQRDMECNGGKSSALFALPTPFPYNCCAYKIDYKTSIYNGLKITGMYVIEATQIRSNSALGYPDKNDDDNYGNHSSLAPGHLRGEINDLWIKGDLPKWFNTSQGGKKRKTKRRSQTSRRKTRRLFTLKKGDLTKYGYHANLSKTARHKALKKARAQYQPLSLSRKLNAVYVLNKNRDKKRAAIFKQDANWVKILN
jgi:hypothetical protein